MLSTNLDGWDLLFWGQSLYDTGDRLQHLTLLSILQTEGRYNQFVYNGYLTGTHRNFCQPCMQFSKCTNMGCWILPIRFAEIPQGRRCR